TVPCFGCEQSKVVLSQLATRRFTLARKLPYIHAESSHHHHSSNMLLRKVLAQPAKNVSESLGDRAAVATPATLPPWLPTAFSVGAYVFLGPKPAIFVAVSMILLTYVGGLL
ncbi:hypothetical protein Vretimale_15641, partial [Volvox reticuliferus]